MIDVPLGADQSHIASVVASVLAWAKAQPPAEGLGHLRSWRDDREVCRSQIVSDQQAAGIEGPALDRLLGRSTTTRADRNRTKRRAETLGRNKYLADESLVGALDRGPTRRHL